MNVIPIMNDRRILSSKEFPLKTYGMITASAVQFRDEEDNTIRYFPSDKKSLTKIKQKIKARTEEVKLICPNMKYSIKRNDRILEDIDFLIGHGWMREDTIDYYNSDRCYYEFEPMDVYVIDYGYEAGFQYINLSKDTLMTLLSFHNDNVLRVYLTFTRLLHDGQFRQVTREYLAQQIGLQINNNTLERIGHITDTLHSLGLVIKVNARNEDGNLISRYKLVRN